MRDGFFDPAKRAAAKQAARDRGDADLRERRVSRERLQHRNGDVPPSRGTRPMSVTQRPIFDPQVQTVRLRRLSTSTSRSASLM